MVKDKHIISGINGFFHKAPYFVTKPTVWQRHFMKIPSQGDEDTFVKR